MRIGVCVLLALLGQECSSVRPARALASRTKELIPAIETTAAFSGKGEESQVLDGVNEILAKSIKPSPYQLRGTKGSVSDDLGRVPTSVRGVLDGLNSKIRGLRTGRARRYKVGAEKLKVVAGLGGLGRESDDDHDLEPGVRLVSAPNLLQLLLRAITLAVIFAPVFAMLPLALLWRPIRNRILFPLLAGTLAKSGPAFIKWGQWASTRGDMFPERLCACLSALHANAPAHGWKFTKRTVEEALAIDNRCGPEGDCMTYIFEEFEKVPVASGSIAQVHRAVVRSGEGKMRNGTEVAIKVRHPMVAELIDRDFRIMRKLAAVVDLLSGGWLSVKSSIDQFSHTMAEQARLDVEAYHLDLLNWNFRGWKELSFPRTIFSSQSVIIETFEKGEIVSDLMGLFNAKISAVTPDLARFIVTTGESLYLKMLLVDNLMHADLHPGNIMIDASVEGDPRMTLVDAGMVAELTEEESVNFIGLLSALGAGDSDKASEAVLGFGGSRVKNDAFTEDMKVLFTERCRGYGTNVDVGDVLRGVLGLVRKHQVRINANYATLVVNVLCIEAMAKKLLPKYNVLDGGRPLLQAYRKILCYKPKSKVRRALFRMWMPIAHICKARNDNKFFKKLSRKDLKKKHSKIFTTSARKFALMLSSSLIAVTLAILSSAQNQPPKQKQTTKFR